MKHKKQTLFGHSMQMLRRNLHSYGLLSVTIVLSFSILLGYLSFVDAGVYNQYKEIFAAPREVVMVYDWSDDLAISALTDMVQRSVPQTQYYRYTESNTQLTQYGNVYATLTFLPEGNRPVYHMVNSAAGNLAVELHPLMGKENFALQGNQAIINQDFYAALGGTGEFPISLQVPYTWEDGTQCVFSLEVVGVYSDDVLSDRHQICMGEDGYPAGYVQIYLSQSLLGNHTAKDLDTPKYIVWFSSENPSAVADCAAQFDGMTRHAVCEAQDKALENIRVQKATKAVIAVILLLLLGTNLYSSFENALDGRKYEIGIKRAIGAPAWTIVVQFLLEAMAVMMTNILLSVLIVTDMLALYKIYQAMVLGEQWVIAVSGYSIAMFAVCSISLTVVFSLIFAYRSTKVEIAGYLKSE